MSSKRHVRRRSCEGKIRYADNLAAGKAARSASRFKHETIWPYRCAFCRGFHIGHPPGVKGELGRRH